MEAVLDRRDEGKTVDAQVEDRRLRLALNVSKYFAVTTAIGVILTAIIGLSLWLFFGPYFQVLVIAGGVSMVTASARLYPVLRQRGWGTVGILPLLLATLSMATIAPLLIPDLMPAAPIACILIIILGNLLLGDRGARWLSGACALALAADYVLLKEWAPRWFTPLSEQSGLITGVSLLLVTWLVATVVVRAITLGQEESFRQAQQARLETEQHASAEEEQRQHLQSTVEWYVTFMAQVAQGNLSARLPLDASTRDTDDPLMLLGHNLNDTVASLEQMIVQIRDAAMNLNSSSAEILTATAQQAAGASQQSASIAQASATINEVRCSAEQTAGIAQGVSELAQHTAQVTQAGQQAVADTITGMQEVRQKVETIAQNILALSEQAQAIGQIVATVSEIAAQSNILALNAAVEAARAGEAGKGFAVVAGEVRSLAEQSRAATVQVKEILSEIQRGVNTAVMATEEGMKKADVGIRLASEAGGAIEKLGASVSESTQAAAQIAAAAGQQLTGVTQISQAMQSIDQATAQSVAGARQVEQAAADLNDLATELRGLIERYGV